MIRPREKQTALTDDADCFSSVFTLLNDLFRLSFEGKRLPGSHGEINSFFNDSYCRRDD